LYFLAPLHSTARLVLNSGDSLRDCPMNKLCKQCKNSLDESAFDTTAVAMPDKWDDDYGWNVVRAKTEDVCRGCLEFMKET